MLHVMTMHLVLDTVYTCISRFDKMAIVSIVSEQVSYVSYLVRNPEDEVSPDMAHL